MSGRNPQRGMVLVTSLLLLVVVTILAVAMFRSFGIDEKIAGNVREKTRALSAAETAEQYAEYWLTLGNGGPGIVCTTPVYFTVGQICTNRLTPTTAGQVPWAAQVIYNPTTAGGILKNVTGTGADNSSNFSQWPAFYITNIGAPPGGRGVVYQIDAVGYGGSANTVAVVETNYLVQTAVRDAGAL